MRYAFSEHCGMPKTRIARKTDEPYILTAKAQRYKDRKGNKS